MNRTRFWIALTLSTCVSAAPVRAAHVEGYGTIETNLSNPAFVSIETAYEDPVFLDVRKIVQLSHVDLGSSSGYKTFDYFGEARAGRLRARSRVAGPVVQNPELDSGVNIGMEFHDQITPQDLVAAVRYLRVDVELSGRMTRVDLSPGNDANARLAINMEDVESSINKGLYYVEFDWSADNRSISDVIPLTGLGAPRFVSYPGEEPRFTQVPIGGAAYYAVDARGYLDVPLDGDEEEGPVGLLFGEPFRLRVSITSDADCGTEPGCLADTNFIARIDNARFVDASGDPVAGPSLMSESGYDYITAPEPEGVAMGLIAIGVLGGAARRRQRSAAA